MTDVGSRLLIAHGAREAEACLLVGVGEAVDAARRDPVLLVRPLRVVVPSRSLRQHVSDALVRRFGSIAGVLVQTLHGLALEVHERAGETPLAGDALFSVLVRRHAREEPDLRGPLEPLDDGYGAVVGAVSDLLDAGFDGAAHTEPIEEWIAAAGLGPVLSGRARAVVRTAARTARSLAEAGCGRRGLRLVRARDLLEDHPEHLPARGVWIHGFAEATGVASDLLALLVRQHDAHVVLDVPPDPSAGASARRPDVGVGFLERLRLRVSAAGPARDDGAWPAPPRLRGFGAPGAAAEVRAVAEAVRARLDAGARPESIAVVTRVPQTYRTALRRDFGRLGIPFSGGSPGPSTPVDRRVRAFQALLDEGVEVAADRWLDLWEPLEPVERLDLRQAFHGLGAARLREAAGLDLERWLEGKDYLPLAVLRGLSTEAGDEDDEPGSGPRSRAVRRSVGRWRLERALAAAAGACERLAGRPERAALHTWLAVARALLADLGAAADEGFGGAVHRVLDGLEAEIPGELELERGEFDVLLRRVLEDVGRADLGGAGAGVAVLSVMEARARTFDHLFVLGLNRDVFPRVVTDDALLPDDLRRGLVQMLPELPVKARGFEEEHYLFAQLVSASPDVTLSWQKLGDDDKARSPSPLVEQLRLGEAPFAEDADGAPALHARPSPDTPRPAHEAALLEGLHGRRDRFVALLAPALAEVIEAPADALAELAAVRAAVLAEWDPRRSLAEALGPHFGSIGPVRESADPRRRDLSVTLLEGLAACPWQTFLRRLLRLEMPPDALVELPGLDPLKLGNLVHRVLEELVLAALPGATGPLDAERAPLPVPWPEPDALRRRTRAAAEALLREAGVGPPAFAELLVEPALPLLEAARRSDWPEPDAAPGCLGAEVESSVAVKDGRGGERRVHFRADRADRVDGRLRLIDYKAGRPLSTARTARTQRRDWLAKVAAGTHLQAVAYALGVEGSGRYLYLAGDPEAGNDVFQVEADDPELGEAFGAAVRSVIEAYDRGAFFPRLVEPDGDVFRRCDWCEVRDACAQGDSGARRRLLAWMNAAPAEASDADRAARALWRLAAPEQKA